jgi:hypothetical protein
MTLKTTSVRPDVPEKAIQAAIIRHLSMAGFLVVRVNSAAFKNDNGFYVRGYSVAGLSVSAGHPDLVAYKGTEALFIEVKKPKGQLSESQEKFHEYAKTKGVAVYVVRSIEDLEKVLAQRHAPQGEEERG